MPQVLVDQAQLDRLNADLDAQKTAGDTIFSLLTELRNDLALKNTQTEADLTPMLDKADKLVDLFGGMAAPTVPDTTPTVTATTDARDGIDPATTTPPNPAIGDTVTIPGVDGPQKVTEIGPDGTLTVEPVTVSAANA